ncbi:MAG: hypothetical protein JZD40_00215 [Sulfolobus sp.]|nr:hypothetical protein [Sulfolobus sp.]
MVYYHKDIFPEYEKLLDELEKIPNVTITGIYEFEGQIPHDIAVLLNTLGLTIAYKPPEIKVFVNGKKTPEEEATVNNNNEAISQIVFYTGYYLTRFTGDEKFLEPREVDKNRVIVKYLTVTRVNDKERIQIIGEGVSKQENCILNSVYDFTLTYMLGYRNKFVGGYAVCCKDILYLLVDYSSEHGHFDTIWHVLNTAIPGKKCTDKNVETIIRKKENVKAIDEYVEILSSSSS